MKKRLFPWLAIMVLSAPGAVWADESVVLDSDIVILSVAPRRADVTPIVMSVPAVGRSDLAAPARRADEAADKARNIETADITVRR